MVKYGFPLLIGGLAYVTNEMADRLLLEHLLPKDVATAQVGIYNACYTSAIFMTLIIQGLSVTEQNPFSLLRLKKQTPKKNMHW